jgi:hypothetical protein
MMVPLFLLVMVLMIVVSLAQFLKEVQIKL